MDLEGLIKELKGQGIKDKRVLEAIKKIDRKKFVPKELRNEAYENTALPLKKGQTISQPYTVAVMLEALELKKGDKVLEIGTGSGWNAALIAEIINPGKVYTLEIVDELIELARENIKKFNLNNVKIIKNDGGLGYEKEAPYDKIILTAACPKIPEILIKQLKENGILVAPVGFRYGQNMIKLKKKNGRTYEENLGNFIFVPLIGKEGY